jgi:hypothetical protein
VVLSRTHDFVIIFCVCFNSPLHFSVVFCMHLDFQSHHANHKSQWCPEWLSYKLTLDNFCTKVGLPGKEGKDGQNGQNGQPGRCLGCGCVMIRFVAYGTSFHLLCCIILIFLIFITLKTTTGTPGKDGQDGQNGKDGAGKIPLKKYL